MKPFSMLPLAFIFCVAIGNLKARYHNNEVDQKEESSKYSIHIFMIIFVSTFKIAHQYTLLCFLICILDHKKEFIGSGRIVGGAGRLEDEDPASWNVAFMTSKRDIYCGGVLLSDKYILTAAHCKFDGNEDGLRFDGKDLALVGAKKKTDALLLTLTKTYFVHEQYETFESDTMGELDIYDFMIVVLITPNSLERGCRSRFVRLPKKGLNEHKLKGVALSVVGWGNVALVTHQQILNKIRKGIAFKMVQPDHMMETDLSLVPARICQKRYQEMFNEWGSVRGIKPDPKTGSEASALNDKPGQYYISDINFSKRSGNSMLCASMCAEEDLSSCTEKHGHNGACMGDSGCKYWNYDFNAIFEEI